MSLEFLWHGVYHFVMTVLLSVHCCRMTTVEDSGLWAYLTVDDTIIQNYCPIAVLSSDFLVQVP